jgi:chromosome segregation ATPase
MEKESKEVGLPDFTEAAKEYSNLIKHMDELNREACQLDFEAGSKYGYLLGYNKSHSKLKLRIEELEKIIKKADEVVKATDHLLTGLATDGNAIEGFTDAWRASHDFLEERIKYEIDLVAEKLGISELKNTL